MNNPLKQGLKQRRMFTNKMEVCRVTMNNPLKQGLKPSILSPLGSLNARNNEQSIKTRIKT